MDSMTPFEYQRFVHRMTQFSAHTTAENPESLEVWWAVSELYRESGEAFEVILKDIRKHGEVTPDTLDQLEDELGDILWSLTACCNALDIPLDTLMSKNIDKLRRRSSASSQDD